MRLRNIITISLMATSAALAALYPPGASAAGGFHTGVQQITRGGTGATTAAGARTNLGVAGAGANSDITSLTALTQIPKNIGVGVAPSTWGTSYTPIDFGTSSAIAANGNGAPQIYFNLRHDGANTKYKTSTFGTMLELGAGGDVNVYTAPSGTAGNTATMTLKYQITNDGTVKSYKACASGYTRVSPNYCVKSNLSSTNATPSGTCIAIAAPSSDAKAIVLQLRANVFGSNSAGVPRSSDIYAAWDNLCANTNGEAHAVAFEATATTQPLATDINTAVVKTSSPGASVYVYPSLPGNSTAVYAIVGYYD